MNKILRRGYHYLLSLSLIAAVALCLLIGVIGYWRLRGAFPLSRSPNLPTPDLHRPRSTPPIAETFDFPLLPAKNYGPYAQGVTGPRAIDTRFAAQNPALGKRPNCFRDREGNTVPFSELYHAGVDLFALGQTDSFLRRDAAGKPVRAVADGIVVSTLGAGAEGEILIIGHRMPDGNAVYSVYWHVDKLRVALRQAVERGEVIAVVHDQGLNSHLHWEMRTFLDGSALFQTGSAGARGTCNGHFAAVGYTWDDAPERARPEFYGYMDPLAFVAAHQ